MAVYSLPTPAVGSWAYLDVPADTQAIMFKNDSMYDFLLKFGGKMTPNFTTSLGGQADGQVNAYEYPVVPTVKRGASAYEQQLNAMGAFDGRIWYLAQDNTGGLASVGTISSRKVLTVLSYGPFDIAPPSGQAVGRAVDLSSQTRLVSIPPGMQQWFSQTGTIPNGGNSTILGAIGLSALNKTNGRAQAYLSKFRFQMNSPGAAAVGFASFQADFVIRNNAAVVLATIPIMPFTCFTAGQQAPNEACSEIWPLPLCYDQQNLPANSFDVALRLTTVAASAAMAGAGFTHHSVWWVDLVNAEPIAAPGNATLHTSPGALY